MTRKAWLFLGLLTGVAAALSLVGWPHTPRGLHQDELLTGYESWSLAHTFRDQWGAFFPAYFLSWGSGQTVLASYLAIPFTGLFGLNEYTIRLPELLAGIGLVPLAFFTVKRVCSDQIAWLATTLVALSLWRLQVSRWGVEANLLPFLVLLGVLLYHRALATDRRWVRVISLLPFALAFYAYGTSIYVIPVLLLLLAIRDWKTLREASGQWLSALALWVFLSAPMGLAMMKNFVFSGKRLPGESLLPFSLPSLPERRLDQVADQSKLDNVSLFLHGLNDGLPWNSVGSHQNVSVALIVLALGALALELKRRELSSFSLWLIACLPLAVLAPLNTNRANLFVLPLLILAAKAGVEIWHWAKASRVKQALIGAVGLALTLQGLWGLTAYFTPAHQNRLAYAFLEGLVPAIQEAPEGEDPILVDPEVPIPYISVLFADQVENQDFYEGNTLDSIRVGRWALTPIDTPPRFLYLTRRPLSPGQAPQCETVKAVGDWTYYACVAE